MANDNPITTSRFHDLGLRTIVFDNEEKERRYQADRTQQLFALASVLIKHDFEPHPKETKVDAFGLLSDLTTEFKVVSGLDPSLNNKK